LIIDAALFFAIGAAFLYAVADIAMRSGLQHVHPFVGSTIGRIAGVVTLFTLILLSGIGFPPLGTHYLWVALGGAFNPGLFAIFFMYGITKIGVARAAPIKGSSPLFASLLAIFFLGERPEWYHLGGVLLVVSGIALISSGRTEGRWKRSHALWPITAAGFAGLGAVIWRKGLPAFPDALAGAFVGLIAALTVVGLYTLVFLRDQVPDGVRKAWKPFVLVGVVGSVGQFFFASALQRGEVYRIISLIQTSPLITVLFALILLRRVESITWRVPAGALLTVSGAILVNLRF